jgi:hypothetical protein
MSTSRRRAVARHAILSLSVATSLAACYVIPIDPRTDAPHVVTTREAQGTGPVTAIAPPAAVGPPQASVLMARLYPLNAQAKEGGLLTALVVDNNTGRGSFTLAYLGDTLQGEATRVDTSYAAFGRVDNEVLGTSQRAFRGQARHRQRVRLQRRQRAMRIPDHRRITGHRSPHVLRRREVAAALRRLSRLTTVSLRA